MEARQQRKREPEPKASIGRRGAQHSLPEATTPAAEVQVVGGAEAAADGAVSRLEERTSSGSRRGSVGEKSAGCGDRNGMGRWK